MRKKSTALGLEAVTAPRTARAVPQTHSILGPIPCTFDLKRAADELADKIIAKSASLPTLYDVSARSTLATTGGKALSRVSASGSTMTGVGSSFSPSTAAPAPSLTLMIGKVDGRKLYITGGSNAGVTLNQAIEVRRMSGTMKDASGVDIPIEETVEVAVITDVEDRYSVAELQHGDKSEAKIGDKVKLLDTYPEGGAEIFGASFQTAVETLTPMLNMRINSLIC